MIFYDFLTDIIEMGANAVGMSIPPPATTESGDRDIKFDVRIIINTLTLRV